MSFVQEKAGAGSSSTLVTVTPDSTLTEGNAIAIGVNWFGGAQSISSITDQSDNALTFISLEAVNIGSHQILTAIVRDLPSGVTGVKITFDGADDYNAQIIEWSGIKTSGGAGAGYDSASLANFVPGTATDAVTSGTVSLASQPSAVIGYARNASGSENLTAGTGFTQAATKIGPFSMVEYVAFTSTGSKAATFTTSSAIDDFPVAMTVMYEVSGPVLTGPATITDGTSSTWTGTDLDTLASTGDVFLKETAIATASKLQTYGTVTATTIPSVVNDIGQDELRDSGTSPVAGIAVTADIEAAGATTAVHLLSADDGTNPEDTFSTVITTETTIQTVQTMASVAVTGSGLGLFASNIITTVENNHQCSIPKIVDGVTITLNANGDGTLTVLQSELDLANGSITFDALYYSPSTKQWAKVAITLTEAGLNVGNLTKLNIGIGIGI